MVFSHTLGLRSVSLWFVWIHQGGSPQRYCDILAVSYCKTWNSHIKASEQLISGEFSEYGTHITAQTITFTDRKCVLVE